MWFEILPAAFIIGGAIAFPGLCIIVMNKLIHGNIYNRDLTLPLDRRYYLRDSRLSNNPYKQFGLETIEDDKPGDNGGESSGICKLGDIMDTNRSPPQNVDSPISTNHNNSNPPPQDGKSKDKKDQTSESVKTDAPDGPKKKTDEPKKKRTDSQIELKKDIILGSAGHGGPASARGAGHDECFSDESHSDSTH